MKTLSLSLLLLLCAITRAEDDVYLWVRNYETAVTKLAQLDTALGYPSTNTLTWRAVDYTLLTNGTNAVVRLDLSDVWSPKYNRYVNLADAIKDRLTEAQWGTEIVTNVAGLQGKAVARISGDLARKAAMFLSQTN